MSSSRHFRYGVARYETWYRKYDLLLESEISAIKMILPVFEKGIEIGAGTGIFSFLLGIKEGVEPVAEMALIAQKRGIRILSAYAENLPLDNESYDFVLMVTADCFLNDIEKAFHEINRILVPSGWFMIGFIDRDSNLGQHYENKKATDDFYRDARFHSAIEISSWLTKTGFALSDSRQTVFTYENTYQEPILGHGLGGFVVMKAQKPKR
jgi:SAM-dependent methyltransferase